MGAAGRWRLTARRMWAGWLLVTAGCAFPISAGAQSRSVAVVDVSVIPVDSARILRGQTVVVEGERIVAVGPRDAVALPPGTDVIDGRGGYLIPGLADMHTHFGRDDLGLFLANGVTTVRLMWGWSDPIRWRDSIASGALLGPSMFVAGTIIEGSPPAAFASVIDTAGRAMVHSESEGRMEVLRQRMAGVDFIKVYNNVSREAYSGIVDQARRLGLTVAGHVPFDVGLRGVLEAGQSSIEHLRGYVWELVPSDAPQPPDRDLRSRALAWAYADTSRFDELVQLTRGADAVNVPTLVVGEVFLSPQNVVERYLAGPAAPFFSDATRETLRHRERIPWLSNFSDDDFVRAREGLAVQRALVRALHEGGATILAGTDVSPAGFALHWELEQLVRAGLTPYDALVAATRGPAEFLAWNQGVIQPGRRADLVLLRANPLEDITNTQAIEGVMVRGVWLDRSTLDSILVDARGRR